MSNIEQFVESLVSIESLVPRKVDKRLVAPPIYTRQVVTIVGLKTATSRFLPVSHEGQSNETYVDKVNLLGKQRAEFIGRKMKGIERRAHMVMYREMVEKVTGEGWSDYGRKTFGSACVIPDGLCLACWNCSLFGGMVAGAGATFSRIRYFDTYSVEDGLDCIASESSEEGMGIGNTVSEDVAKERGAESYHLYEYVKPGTRFPFITIIESPTLLDVSGYLNAVIRADAHGYGKYSASHGKFSTIFLAVATGYPRFSVLDMLGWNWDDKTEINERFSPGSDKTIRFDNFMIEFSGSKETSKFEPGEPLILWGEEIHELARKLPGAFNEYIEVLSKGPSMENAIQRGRKGAH